MHDTFLNHNIYEYITHLCKQNSIKKIGGLTITVHTHSHISKESIIDHFRDRNSTLIGDWTDIVVLRKEIEPLTATVDQIDGE